MLFASYAAAQTGGKPALNVVLITIDTLRADHVGCYGYKKSRRLTLTGWQLMDRGSSVLSRLFP